MASNQDQKGADKLASHANHSNADAAQHLSDYIIDAINHAHISTRKQYPEKPDQQCDVEGKQALNPVADQAVENDRERQYFKKHGQHQGQNDKSQKLDQASWRQKQGSLSNRNYYQKPNDDHRRNLDRNWRNHPRQQQVKSGEGSPKFDQNFNDSCTQRHHRSSDNSSSGYHHGEQEFNRRRNVDQPLRQSSKQQHQNLGNDNSSNRHQNDQQNAYQRSKSDSKQPQHSHRISHSSSRDEHYRNGFYMNRNAKQYPNRNNYKRQEVKRSFSRPITFDNLPSWKLFLLRSSYDQDQIVEFHRHNGSYYDDEEDIDKLFYSPHLLHAIQSNQQEITDIAGIFQEWIDKVQTKCTDPSIFNGIYVKIRYGCSYITLLDPYIDQMPVPEFKAHFNRFLSKTDQSTDSKPSHRILTGFYPICSSCPIDMNDHAASMLSFDSQTESILIHVESEDYKTQNAVNYNAEMELIEYKKDIILFKLDIKNTSKGNDVETINEGKDARITLYSDICKDNQEIPSNCQLISKDTLPPIRRDSHNRIVVQQDYRQAISSVRHKQVKSYKLKDDMGLWDPFRQAVVVNVADVTEYRFVDQATGQFNDVHRKHEINVKVPLYQLLKPENCHNLAQSIHSLTFTILPECFSQY